MEIKKILEMKKKKELKMNKFFFKIENESN